LVSYGRRERLIGSSLLENVNFLVEVWVMVAMNDEGVIMNEAGV